MKMLLRSQWLGTGEAMTRSLLSAIMAPSLNTASSTIRMVGKYLRGTLVPVKMLARQCCAPKHVRASAAQGIEA